MPLKDSNVDGTDAQRRKDAIDVLRKLSAESGRRAPLITESSPGVMLNRARAFLKQAS